MRLLMMSVLVVALTGCASNVVTDYDSAAAFNLYSTWAFAPDAGDTSFMSLDGSRVQAAVERELSEKSLSKVADNKADLLVSWDIKEEKSHERSGVGLGFGFGSGNFGWGMSSPPPVREVKEGKLVIQLVDTANNQVVWRSASRRYLNEDQPPEDRRKLINEVVKEMFSKYPPGLD
jgi:hypothetical protein